MDCVGELPDVLDLGANHLPRLADEKKSPWLKSIIDISCQPAGELMKPGNGKLSSCIKLYIRVCLKIGCLSKSIVKRKPFGRYTSLLHFETHPYDINLPWIQLEDWPLGGHQVQPLRKAVHRPQGPFYHGKPLDVLMFCVVVVIMLMILGLCDLFAKINLSIFYPNGSRGRLIKHTR